MSATEKVEAAMRKKEEGNGAFKNGNVLRALRKYEKALELVKSEEGMSDDERRSAKDLTLKVNGNMALIYLKKKEYEKCVEKATLVIKEDENNLKALGRRGMAYSLSGSYEKAKKDLLKAKKIEPTDKFVLKAIKENKRKIKMYREKQKKLYGNMFGGSTEKEKEKEKS